MLDLTLCLCAAAALGETSQSNNTHALVSSYIYK